MRYLRKNTAVIVSVGPFYDKTDGVTIEGSLTITNERITLVADTDDGSAPTLVLDNVTGATSGTDNDLNYITGVDAGIMQLELSAANTNRNGRLLLSITDAANHVPVFHEFMVLDGAVYDSLVLGTDKLAVDAQEISSDSTAADNAELMFDGTGYAGGTTKLGVDVVAISGDATAADNLEAATDGNTYNLGGGAIVAASVTGAVGSVTGAVGSVTAGVTLANDAITAAKFDETTAFPLASADAGATAVARTGADADTLETLSDQLDGAALEATAQAILADTDDIGVAGAGLTAVPWNAAWDAEVESEATDALNAYDPPTNAELTSAVANVSVDEIQATALADLFNTDSGTTYAAAVAGSVVKEIADNASGSGATAAEVWEYADRQLTALDEDVTTLDLDGTAVGSVVGAVGSVTGAVGSVTGNVGGNVTGSVGSVTGNVGGNVTGSVGSVAAGGITAASIATGAVDADALATDAVDEIVDAVWDELLTGALHNIATSAGRRLRQLGDAISGTVTDVTPSATNFDTSLAGYADDHFNDQLIYFTTGALTGQVKPILDFADANNNITLGEALTAAPANGDAFDILPVHVHPPDQIATAVWASADRQLTALDEDATTIDLDGTAVGSVVGAVGSVTAGVTLANDAITAAKYDETTAFPLASADSGATQVARTGADADTLETLSDQLDGAALEATAQAILTDTGEIGAAGAGLTAIPWNAAWDTEVESEATDALNAYDPPTNAELTSAVANVSVDEIQATALADLFNTDSGTTFAAAVAGSPVKEISDNAGGGLTEAGIAGAVWDEPIADHLDAGSTGEQLNAAGAAGDPWITALPGAYGAGTAGKIVGDNINATISSRATAASIAALNDLTAQEVRDAMKLAPTAGTPAAGSVDKHLDDIQAITDEIDVSAVTAVTLYDGGTITLIAGSVFDETLSGVTVPADWQTCVWTVKRHRRQVDAKAILQVLVTNGGDVDDGLQVLNSDEPESPITAADASVTVNAGASTVRLLALDTATAELDAVIPEADEIEGLFWDVKFTRPAGMTPVPAQEGDVTIRYAATHAH